MYEGAASSILMYALVIIGLIGIFLFSFAYLRKGYQRCLEFGMSKEKLARVIRSSLIFSIVPSLAIVIGLFTLSAVFDIPWPWWRLSVIGSVAYELMAGQSVASAVGGGTAPSTFVAIMFGMTIGTAGWILGPIILGKRLGGGIKKERGENPGWSMVFNSVFWSTMMCVYLPEMLFGDRVNMAVLFTSAAITGVLGVIANKMNWAWLKECTLALTLIFGMMSALLWTSVFN